MWLYIPSEAYPYAPVSEALTSGSDGPWAPGIAPWVTLSGTPTQRAASWRGWKTRAWIQLLSGMTLRPSTAGRGAARWISSLLDSPVKISAPPAAAKGSSPVTAAGSGMKLRVSFAKWDRGSCSWKTSQRSLLGDSELFLETWPLSGSMRNGTCSARQESERHTFDSDFSFWALDRWATPTSRDWKDQSCSDDHPTNSRLGMQAVRWSPPPMEMHSLPDQPTPPDGGPTCGPAVLNHLFVEALMGFPRGWTECAVSAAQSSQQLPAAHFGTSQDARK